MPEKPRLRRQRAWLWEYQHGRCFWCRCQMVQPEGDQRHLPKRLRNPPNMATIDHLDSRLSPERGQHSGEWRHVLACRTCNEARSAAETAELPAVELWQRSGRAPGRSTKGGFTGPLPGRPRRATGLPLGLVARIVRKTGDSA